jgi:hypothetical protein
MIWFVAEYNQGQVGNETSNTKSYPELSGKTAVSPALKSKVLALALPVNAVARAVPWWKYSHSSAC